MSAEEVKPLPQDPSGRHRPESGAIATQNAIINAELMWYGRLMNSSDIHASLGATAISESVPAATAEGGRRITYAADSNGNWEVIFEDY